MSIAKYFINFASMFKTKRVSIISMRSNHEDGFKNENL